MTRVAADPNGAGFLKIWRLPESANLKAQTLDKLALAPWQSPTASLPLTLTNYEPLVRQNPAASQLRPLLDDLVQEESYLEIREPKTQATQLGLAIHLSAQRAGLWETNLAAVMESLTGGRRAPFQPTGASHGWQIKASGSSPRQAFLHHVELARFGEWTLIGLAADQNQVFEDLLARIQRTQTPLPAGHAKGWLDTVLDLRRLSTAFAWGWDLPEDWPMISLNLNSNGKEVLTSGRLTFPKTLPFQIEPWNIPTNLIHEPLFSFTAVQGLKPWLSSTAWWEKLKTGPAPNQLFCWAQSGSPFLAYAAAPLANASSAMPKIGPAIMDSLNPMLATNRMGKWERATNSDGVSWNKVPIIAPFVRSIAAPNGQLLFAGLTPALVANTPSPTGTLQDLLSRPNAVYFDREVTGPRVEAWMFLSQLSRIILRREQLPSEAKAVVWLRAAGPSIGPTFTTLTKTGPAELSLARTSSLGLTAPELHLMADWLESPQFPRKLFTSVAKLPPFPPRRTASNRP